MTTRRITLDVVNEKFSDDGESFVGYESAAETATSIESVILLAETPDITFERVGDVSPGGGWPLYRFAGPDSQLERFVAEFYGDSVENLGGWDVDA